MPVALDNQQAGLMALSATNMIAKVGGTDSTVSGNATITLLKAAILALAPVIGAGPDANRQVTIGLQWGVNAGLLSATHGYTTIAGMAAGIQAQLGMDVPTTYTGSFPQ